MEKGDIRMTLGIDENSPSVLIIHKEYPITQFNWTLEFIFKQDRYSDKEALEISEVVAPLLSTSNKDKLTKLFNKNTYNSALTASDKINRKSFMILTQVTSIGQFSDSLVHEMLHLSRHIDECDNSEQLFTILGNISGDIIKKLYSL